MKALRFLIIFSILAGVLNFSSSAQIINNIPITGLAISSPLNILDDTTPSTSTLADFIESIKNGDSSTIRGIFVENLFNLKVVQQPRNDANFVSSSPEEATQFALAKKYGTIGLLAHNFSSGSNFFKLKLGDIVQMVYGDGRIERYKITHTLQFQALQPDSPQSQFLDLQSQVKLSSTALFKKVYSGKRQLTLQTCIEKDGLETWGRLFLIAMPIQ